jgi:hypothetical protein
MFDNEESDFQPLVYGHSLVGIAGSNPAAGMYV